MSKFNNEILIKELQIKFRIVFHAISGNSGFPLNKVLLDSRTFRIIPSNPDNSGFFESFFFFFFLVNQLFFINFRSEYKYNDHSKKFRASGIIKFQVFPIIPGFPDHSGFSGFSGSFRVFRIIPGNSDHSGFSDHSGKFGSFRVFRVFRIIPVFPDHSGISGSFRVLRIIPVFLGHISAYRRYSLLKRFIDNCVFSGAQVCKSFFHTDALRIS